MKESNLKEKLGIMLTHSITGKLITDLGTQVFGTVSIEGVKYMTDDFNIYLEKEGKYSLVKICLKEDVNIDDLNAALYDATKTGIALDGDLNFYRQTLISSPGILHTRECQYSDIILIEQVYENNSKYNAQLSFVYYSVIKNYVDTIKYVEEVKSNE